MPETPPLPPVTAGPHNVHGPNAEPDTTANDVSEIWGEAADGDIREALGNDVTPEETAAWLAPAG